MSYILASTGETAAIDPDKSATSKADIFQEAAERLRIAEDAMSENIANAIEALQFENGDQWPADISNQRKIDRRPSLTINHTRTFCRRVINNLRQQRPRIKVHPTGDGAQIEDAQVIEGMIRHIENRSNASVAYDTAGESAVKIGWGYARLLTEYAAANSNDQEIRIAAIRNPFTVYDDPSAIMPTGQDREWALISELMPRTEYKRKYRDMPNTEWRRGQRGDDKHDWETKTHVRLAEYFRIVHKSEDLYQMADGSTKWFSDIDNAMPSEAYARDGNGNPAKRKSARRTVEWHRLNGCEVVESVTLPGNWIPLVRCLGNVLDVNGKVTYKGMIADLMDANRMYNYWASKNTEVVALAPISPWIMAEGQADGHPEWNDANQKPTAYLTYKPVHSMPDNPESPLLPPPMRQEPVQVQAGIMETMQGVGHDLMALAGMPHEPGQDQRGQVVSGKALRERAALSDIGHFQYYDNQTQFIAHVGEIALDYIPHYYSTKRMQRIIGEDGVPQMVGINQPEPDPENAAILKVKNDVTVGRYEVVMDTGPGFETKRQEASESMLALLDTKLGEKVADVGSDLVIRNMDFPGAQDLADRLMPQTPDGMKKVMEQLPKQAQNLVTGLMKQTQQLQQELQKAQMELKYKMTTEQGWMQVEREKFGANNQTKLHDTSINAQTKVFDTHVKSVTARDVAEINAGAKLIDSNQDRDHEKELAKMTAAAAEKAERDNGK